MCAKLKESMARQKKLVSMEKDHKILKTWPMYMPAYAYTELCVDVGQREKGSRT